MNIPHEFLFSAFLYFLLSIKIPFSVSTPSSSDPFLGFFPPSLWSATRCLRVLFALLGSSQPTFDGAPLLFWIVGDHRPASELPPPLPFHWRLAFLPIPLPLSMRFLSFPVGISLLLPSLSRFRDGSGFVWDLSFRTFVVTIHSSLLCFILVVSVL